MRALVLSGGGAKGAYQVGALRHMLRSGAPTYDVLCGVSVGALNAAFIGMFPRGQEDLARQGLLDLWTGLDTSKVYKKWWGGELAALWRSSVYDSSPLQSLVRQKLDPQKLRTSGRKLRVGAVALASGEFKLFGEEHPEIVNAVLASSAFPAMLSPVTVENVLWTDGGVREVTPLAAAIDLGADACDVVMCSPVDNRVSFPIGANTLRVAGRAIDIMSDQIIEDDLRVAGLVNQLVQAGQSPKRRVDIRIVRPESVLADNSLDFTPAKLRAMQDRGYADAQRLLG